MTLLPRLSNRPRKRLFIETLEDRILCDGAPPVQVAPPAAVDPAAGAPPAAGPASTPAPNSNAIPPNHGAEDAAVVASANSSQANPALNAPTVVKARQEVMFVDGSVPQAADLATNLALSAATNVKLTVLVLDPAQNEVSQITQFLTSQEAAGAQFDAIHLVSHGSESEFRLGGQYFGAKDFLPDQAGALAVSSWKNLLTPGADLLLYGCDVAAGSSGIQLLKNLSAASGLDVAASTNLTGASAKGGDWVLEASTGHVETTALQSTLNLELGIPVAPTVTVSAPSTPFIGDNITITASFVNNDATFAGYGPYIDLYIPKTGADGSAVGAPFDGISVAATGAVTYLGVPCTYTILTLNSANPPLHPYAVDNTGAHLAVTNPAGFVDGDQLLVIQLPFGSFTPGQPKTDITIAATVSNLADVGTGLNLKARGGYQFGSDPLDNPTTDPSIVNAAFSTATVTPQLITLTEVYNGPEGETATGPDFPRSYTINVKVAAGQTVNNVTINDVLSNFEQFLAVTSANPTGVLVQSPSLTVPGSDATHHLIYNFGTITGSGGVDASLTFSFFVPRLDATVNPVIDATTGAFVVSQENLSLTATWPAPIDVRDAGAPITITQTPSAQFTAKSIAIQKSAAVVTEAAGGPAGLSPLDTVEHTLAIQVSDYFAFDNLTLADIISDGQHFDNSFLPTVTVAEHGNNQSWSFRIADFNLVDNWTGAVTGAIGGFGITHTAVAPDGQGTTTLNFDLSAEMIAQAGGLDGKLVGGGIPNGGTGAGPLPNNPPLPFGGTTVTIKYRTVVLEKFVDNHPAGFPEVNQGDILKNDVTISGAVLQVNDVTTATGSTRTDDSHVQQVIVRSTLSKTVYSVNGGATYPASVQISPGDQVTYELKYVIPTGNIDTLDISDYLPLPIFHVDDPLGLSNGTTQAFVFDNVTDATTPAAGHYKFGALDTYEAFTAANGGQQIPTVTVNTTANSLKFSYGNFNSPTNAPLTIHLLFTVTANSDPFANNLFLTNQAGSTEQTTNNTPQSEDAIVQITLKEPDLKITKGIVAVDTTETNAAFSYTGAVKGASAVGATAINLTGFTSPASVGSTISFDNSGGAYNIIGVTNQTLSGVVTTTQVILGTPLATALTNGTVARINVAAANLAPVTFNAPGTAGARFTSGSITSNGLSTKPINADVSGLDNNDTVTFAIAVENIGESRKGAFNVSLKDSLPAGFVAPTVGSLNLRVTDGTGAVVSYTVATSDLDLFTTGLTLNDPGPTAAQADGTDAGAIDQYNGTSGRNIIIITYDLRVDNARTVRDTLVNTATLFNYASTPGGKDFTTIDKTDNAQVTVGAPAVVTKTLVGTSINNANNSNTQAVIGETATYQITVNLPEAQLNGFVLNDVLDPGLAFVQVGSYTASAGLTVASPIGTGAAPANVTISADGHTLAFNFGNITNSNTVNTTAETIVITYDVVVLDDNASYTKLAHFTPPTANPGNVTYANGNQATETNTNYASVDFTGNPQSGSATPDFKAATALTLLEPTLHVSVSSSPSSGLVVGDTVTNTVTITNGNAATDTDAFGLYLNDIFPSIYNAAGLSLTNIQVQNAAGGVGGTVQVNGVTTVPVIGTDIQLAGSTLGTVGGRTIDLMKNSRLVLTVTGVLNNTIVAGTTYGDDATIRWSSMSGTVTTTTTHFDNTNPTNIVNSERDGGTQTPVVGTLTNTENNLAATNQGILDNYASTGRGIITIPSPGVDKVFQGGSITADDTTESTSTLANVLIGEKVIYDLVVTLPEITANNVRVQDLVPAGMRFDTTFNGGLGYQLIKLASASNGLLTGDFDTLATLPVPTLTAAAGVLGTDGAGALFTFGTTNLPTDHVATNNSFIIRVQGIVTDNLTNQVGTTLAGQASLIYDGSSMNLTVADPTPNDHTITVVEPTLAVTVARVGAGTIDAGDTLTQGITLSNTSGQTAFDVTLSNPVDANLTVTAGVIPDATVVTTGGATFSAGAFEIANLGAGNFTVRSTAGAKIDIPTGGSITVNFAGQIVGTVTSSTVIADRANVYWTSTNNANADERTGAGLTDPAPTTINQASAVAPLDNYGISNTLNTSVNSVITVAKTLTTTSQGGADGFVTPGEVVTYRLTFNLSEGIVPNLQVKDLLPTGLAYIAGSITTHFTGFNGYDTGLGVGNPVAIPTATPAVGGAFTSGTGVIFNFASITLPPDNITTNNSFYIEYQAVALDVASNNGLTPAAITTLTNSATHNNGNGAVFGTAAGGASVVVQEPNLGIASTLTVATANTVGSPYSYVITITPKANATSGAYELTLPNFVLQNALGNPSVANATISDGTTSTNVTSSFTLTGQTLSTVTPVNLLLHTAGAANQKLTITINGTLTAPIVGAVSTAITTTTATMTYTNYPGDRTAVGGFDPNPDVVTDHERVYNGTSTVTIAFAASSSLSGTVFADDNKNSAQDASELGLSGVLVRLTGTDQLGSTINTTTATNALGQYSFTGLFSGDYVITEVQPLTYTTTGNSIGTQGGTLSGDTITIVALPFGTNGTGNNFGEYKPVATTSSQAARIQSITANFFFDSLNNPSTSSASDDRVAYRTISPVENYRKAPTTLTPLYSGEATPGATLVIEIFNTKGEVIGSQTVISDAGGNWLSTFPNSIVHDYPNSVRISQLSASYNASTDNGYNLRTYYASALNTGHFFFEYLDVQSVMAKRANAAMDGLFEASLFPIGFGNEKSSYESIGAQGTPSGY